MYAIIETTGKQYRVAPGQVIDVDHMNVADGSTVELDRVLLVADGDKVTVGTPTVSGVKVLATAQKAGRGKKIIVFRFKSKVRERKKTGARASYTTLAIDKIVGPEGTSETSEPAKPARARRKKKEVSESGT